MQTTSKFFTIAVFVFLLVCTSCTHGERYVKQKIPVTIQSGQTITIEINALSGNGPNDVGVRCSPKIWNALTNSAKSITVRVNSSDKTGTQIGGIDPSSSGTSFVGLIPNTHYLFYIVGSYNAKASVEIAFPNAPTGVSPAEIIICKTPADTD